MSSATTSGCRKVAGLWESTKRKAESFTTHILSCPAGRQQLPASKSKGLPSDVSMRGSCWAAKRAATRHMDSFIQCKLCFALAISLDNRINVMFAKPQAASVRQIASETSELFTDLAGRIQQARQLTERLLILFPAFLSQLLKSMNGKFWPLMNYSSGEGTAPEDSQLILVQFRPSISKIFISRCHAKLTKKYRCCSIVERNKRCVLAYLKHRIDEALKIRWVHFVSISIESTNILKLDNFGVEKRLWKLRLFFHACWSDFCLRLCSQDGMWNICYPG